MEDKMTVKQYELIKRLTHRTLIGNMSDEKLSDKIGKKVWDLTKKDAHVLIRALSRRGGHERLVKKEIKL